MTHASDTTRRRFLVSLAALAGWAAGLPGCGRYDRQAARLTAIVKQREPWSAIGAAYLETGPRERRVGSLTKALLRDLEWDPETGSDEELESALAARIQTDFLDGRIVAADGWHLALTEARLAALVALDSRPG